MASVKFVSASDGKFENVKESFLTFLSISDLLLPFDTVKSTV